MDEILAEVKKLGCAELRNKLIEHGEKIGPITGTTKLLFQKRLAKRIFESTHGTTTSDEEQTSAKTAIPDTKLDEVPNDKPVQVSKPTSYYAIYLSPNDHSKGEALVVTAIDELNSLLKKYPGSRFKAFKTEQQAKNYINQDPSLWSKRNESSDSLVLGEKCDFHGPKTQELVQLRHAIEAGRLKEVHDTVRSNPRFLVSSGDTPTILHEGLHYNALHVAAKENKPAICRLLLTTLADPSFTGCLYSQSKDTTATRQNRIDFLMDLYLNSPDRGNCESPLHLACKFGHAEVVQELMAFGTADCTLRNKYEETPSDVVCSRCTGTAASNDRKAQIRELLEGQCYVPLLRAEDNSTAPVIGEPSSPDLGVERWTSQSGSPRNPKLVVKACAGPMSPSRAKQFHKKWATPPPSPQREQLQRLVEIRREDFDKGMERVGRQLAGEMSVQWREYWGFLDAFVDLGSEEGLQQLENHLARLHAITVATSLLQASPNVALTPTDSLLPPPSSLRDPSFPLSLPGGSAAKLGLPLARTLWRAEKSPEQPAPSPAASAGSSSDDDLEAEPSASQGKVPWLASPVGDAKSSNWHAHQEFPSLKEGLEKFKEKYHITSTPIKKRPLRGQPEHKDKHPHGEKHSPKVNLLQRIDASYHEEASDKPQDVQEKSGAERMEIEGESMGVSIQPTQAGLGSTEYGNMEDQSTEAPVDEDAAKTCEQPEPAHCEEFILEGSQPFASQPAPNVDYWKVTRSCTSDSSGFSAQGDLDLLALSLEEKVPTQHSRNSTMSDLCSQFTDKLFITSVMLDSDQPLSPKIDEMPALKLCVSVPPSLLESSKPSSVALMLHGDVEAGEEEGWLQLRCHACFLKESLDPKELVKNTVLECLLCCQDKESLQSLLKLSTVFNVGVQVAASPPEAARLFPVCLHAHIFSQPLQDRQVRRSFLLGEKASKLDLDVYRALPQQINRQHFPITHRWHSRVTTLLQEGDKTSFPSPARLLRDSSSLASRISTPTSFRSLPGHRSSLLDSPSSLSWRGRDHLS